MVALKQQLNPRATRNPKSPERTYLSVLFHFLLLLHNLISHEPAGLSHHENYPLSYETGEMGDHEFYTSLKG